MNKPNENQAGHRERRNFDETYKRHAEELTLRGDGSVRVIAEGLEVTDSMLYDWRRIYAPNPSTSGPAPSSLEDAPGEITGLRGRRLRKRKTIQKIAGHPLRTTPGAVLPGSMR